MPALGIVTGTHVEAACFDGAPAGDRMILCSGLDPAHARAAAARLIAAGCRALASVGTAGGLATGLQPGALIVADSVLGPDGARWTPDAAWRAALMARIDGGGLRSRVAAIAGCDAPALDPDAKRRLHATTGATCCDMESHAVAAVAVAAGVPFLCMRAVADDVADTLPRAALAAVGPDGETRVGALLAALATRPGDVPALIRLALASRKALRSLRRVAALGGPLLALP